MAGSFGVEISGLRELQGSLFGISMRADGATLETVETLQAILIEEARSNFEGTHKKGMPHVGGSKPNIVSGDLQRSIFSEGTHRLASGVYEAQVGPHTKYGRRVELGYIGPNGRGSRAFPYFGPAVHEVRALAEGVSMSWYGKVIAL